jgi:fluoroacetyl-CoA thioesterase
MKDTLAIGLEGTSGYTVTADMSPPHLPVVVLSTPSMVQLIEQTCLLTAAEHLDDNENTVGTHICVSHQAAAAEGEEVEVHCQLADMDRRRLTFDVRVTCGERLLSEGTHQRFVVDNDRFG